jgi:hypothetical protein
LNGPSPQMHVSQSYMGRPSAGGRAEGDPLRCALIAVKALTRRAEDDRVAEGCVRCCTGWVLRPCIGAPVLRAPMA